MASETTPMIETQLKAADRDVRMGFVRKVYGILGVQLLLTVAIALPFQFMALKAVQSMSWLLYLSTGVMLATMCSLVCCAEKMREFPTNYIILAIITACTGVLVGFSCAMYTWQSVLLALGITVGIFLSMTVYAWTTSTDFTGAGPYLFAALMTLCFFGFTLSILSLCGVHIKWAMMFYDFLGVLLFTFYIVYDTQLMIGGNHKVKFSIDDYCFAALNLYLDIINLFLHLLSLLGERK
eukprot:TRINITY_DN647_c0_g1_i2.p1 TRINITY_DN647_c0_g1~~TRINITY_DN647_c0_g1_i2.p1  ORF type:complete len:238 (-),score=52.73 TRINITY_DN647_c0_g1_i2:10-723(-)